MRSDIGMRADSDEIIAVRWMHADGTTPIAVASAILTMTFDLPDDDTWALDVDGVPIPPARQVIAISSLIPGNPEGHVITDGFVNGTVTVVINHTVWAGFDSPLSGTWDLVAVSVDGGGLHRCLTRGEFVCEGAP
jgi:hypothetical protein